MVQTRETGNRSANSPQKDIPSSSAARMEPCYVHLQPMNGFSHDWVYIDESFIFLMSKGRPEPEIWSLQTPFTLPDVWHTPSLFARRGDVPFPRKEDGTLLYDDTDYKVTWAAMEKLVEKGLVRSIGLSNFNSRQIDDVLSVASIKPTVLQVCDAGQNEEQRTLAEVTCVCLTGR